MPTAATNKRIENIIEKMLELKDQQDELKKAHTAAINKIGERYNKWEKKLAEIMIRERMELFGTESGLEAERKMAIFGTIKDPKKLHDYVEKYDAWDLLGNKIGTLAYRARLNDGIKVPGVEQFKKYTINVKRKKARLKR